MALIGLLTLAAVAWVLFAVNLLQDLLDPHEKDIGQTQGELDANAASTERVTSRRRS
jgi:hypothetical protein